MNGIIVRRILLLFIVFPTIICLRKNRSCPTSYCGTTDNLPIKYPFRLESDLRTCEDHYIIILKCNDQGQTVINLPSYGGDFNLKFIDYRHKMIALTDPGNCMPKRLMNKNNNSLLLYPLKPFLYEYYTYYTCPRTSLLSEIIPCLSNSTHATIATSSQESMKETHGCELIVRTEIPVSSGNYYPWSISHDLKLTWYASDHSVGRTTDASNKWATFFASPAFITSATVLSIFSGIALLLRLINVIASWRNTTTSYNNNRAITTSTETTGPNSVEVQDSTLENTPPETSSGAQKRTPKDHTKLLILSESQTSSLPSDATCSICLEEYHAKDTIRYLAQCGHYFHAQCIDLWLHKNGTCPVCRNGLPF